MLYISKYYILSSSCVYTVHLITSSPSFIYSVIYSSSVALCTIVSPTRCYCLCHVAVVCTVCLSILFILRAKKELSPALCMCTRPIKPNLILILRKCCVTFLFSDKLNNTADSLKASQICLTLFECAQWLEYGGEDICVSYYKQGFIN